MRNVGIYNRLASAIIHNGIHREMDIGLIAPLLIVRGKRRELHTTHNNWLVEGKLRPMGLASAREYDILTRKQPHPGVITTTLHRLWHKRLARIIFWSRESDNGNITIVSPLLLTWLSDRQLHIHLTTLDIGARVYQITHSILGLDPRATRHCPARAVLHSERESQTLTLLGGVLNGIIPLLAQAGYILASLGPLATKLTVKEVNTLNSRSGNRLQIGSYTLQRHIATDKVKPRFGIKDLIGREEQLAVSRVKLTGKKLPVGQHSILGISRNRSTTQQRCKSKQGNYIFHSTDCFRV